jgi:hypothetical protein
MSFLKNTQFLQTATNSWAHIAVFLQEYSIGQYLVIKPQNTLRQMRVLHLQWSGLKVDCTLSSTNSLFFPDPNSWDLRSHRLGFFIEKRRRSAPHYIKKKEGVRTHNNYTKHPTHQHKLNTMHKHASGNNWRPTLAKPNSPRY